ncbi:hypothetical protein [Pseudomonas sp. A-R-19]|uniref:hypothetical protein n=1 Tax=Pseudomonas sp. A-R-19 TaxID=2832403 RepID=UPI001CC058C7|nr:hypothetical protein [Pseudomonas sp. A-R-19]
MLSHELVSSLLSVRHYLTLSPAQPQPGSIGSISTLHDWQKTADSVEKVGFSDHLNSGTTTTEEPTHHIEWFFGPSLTFAALLLG